MAYSIEEKENIMLSIFQSMTDEGLSARRSIVKAGISSQTFWAWLDEKDDEGNLTEWAKEKSKQYMRAREGLSEYRFDSISDDYSETPNYDEYGKVDSGWVQLQNMKIRAKQWELSKLNPKKYGDKVETTLKGDAENPIQQKISVEVRTSTAPVANSESDVNTDRAD